MASSYDAYQIFGANVVDGDSDAKIATDLAWAKRHRARRRAACAAQRRHANSQSTAQGSCRVAPAPIPHLTSALGAQAQLIPLKALARSRGP